VRLGVQQLGVDVGGFPAPTGWLAELRTVGGLVLPEQQVVRFPLNQLAGLKAEGLGAGAPPAAGRLATRFAGLDVVPGRVLDRALVDLLPDVIKVVALAQGSDNGQADLGHRRPEATELPMII